VFPPRAIYSKADATEDMDNERLFGKIWNFTSRQTQADIIGLNENVLEKMKVTQIPQRKIGHGRSA
jgi:hypothetical protein